MAPNVDLGALLAAVGKAGRRVVSLRVTLDDSTTLDVALPADRPAAPAAAGPLTAREQAALEFLRSRGDHWTAGKVLAAHLGEDRTSRAFTVVTERLKARGLVESHPKDGYRVLTAPDPDPAPAAEVDPAFRARVLAELARRPGPVKAGALAKALGLKTLKGRGGQMLRALVAAGDVVRRGGLLSDDAAKFPAPAE